jgi:hypothetical protein
MAANEQQLYEFLERIDHPVFPRDMSQVTDGNSPFNSIMNRMFARQLVKLRASIDSMIANSFPPTVDEQTIDRWEETYFGAPRPTKELADRVADLIAKINQKITMSAPQAIQVAEMITGQTPTLIRNLYFGGWVLDESALDVDTILASGDQDSDAGVYILIFADPLDSSVARELDNALTAIEKGGSKHYLIYTVKSWVLDQGALDVDTLLG